MKKFRGEKIFYQASSRSAITPPGFCKNEKQCKRLVQKERQLE